MPSGSALKQRHLNGCTLNPAHSVRIAQARSHLLWAGLATAMKGQKTGCIHFCTFIFGKGKNKISGPKWVNKQRLSIAATRSLTLCNQFTLLPWDIQTWKAKYEHLVFRENMTNPDCFFKQIRNPKAQTCTVDCVTGLSKGYMHHGPGCHASWQCSSLSGGLDLYITFKLPACRGKLPSVASGSCQLTTSVLFFRVPTRISTRGLIGSAEMSEQRYLG